MQFLRESEAVAEQVLEVLYNNSGVTIQRGYPVAFDTRVFADTDGVNVIQPLAGQLNLFYGVAYEEILAGAYGRVQTQGWCDYALVVAHSVNPTIIGDKLAPVANQWYLQRIAAGDGSGALATALEAIAASGVVTPVVRKVLLRCR